MDDLHLLAKNVKHLRRDVRKLLQTELSDRCEKTSQQTISGLENALHAPQLNTVADVAQALGVETWRLLAPPEFIRLADLYLAADDKDRAYLLKFAESLARSPNASPE